MTIPERYHGGLVFLSDAKNTLLECSEIAQETLEDYGHAVEHIIPEVGSKTLLHTASYSVQLALSRPADISPCSQHGVRSQANENRGLRLEITLEPSFQAYSEAETSELLMAVMLFRCLQVFPAMEVEWMDTDTKLTQSQFTSAFSGFAAEPVAKPVRPRRPNSNLFASIDDTAADLDAQMDAVLGRRRSRGRSGLVALSDQEILALSYRTDPHPDELTAKDLDGQPSSQLRLATWAMTGVLATVSAPVAASLAAVNLLRGEDFRLNTQVLSLSAFVAFMQGSGAASAMSLF